MARKSKNIPKTYMPSEIERVHQQRMSATHETSFGETMSAARSNEQNTTPWLPSAQARSATQRSDGLGKMAKGMVSQRESTPPQLPDKQRKAPGAR